MLKELVLSQYNLQIFNFSYIFKHDVERKLINDLYQFELHNNRKDSTVRKLFVHHTIFNVCETLLKTNKKGRHVLFFDDNKIYEGEILEHIEEQRLKTYINYVYYKLKALLPIRVFRSTFTMEYLNFKIKDNSGIGKETLLKIRNLIETQEFDKFTFEKCKKFVKKEGLTFLDKTYFNGLKSKQLLLN